MSSRRNKPVPEMSMPMSTADVACVKAPDPTFEERNELRKEATRALKRLVAFEATLPYSGYMLAKAAKALAELE